ncbi:MAG: hypothetical protein AB2799_21570 [Candidatus Thiodiazotropha sp.]
MSQTTPVTDNGVVQTYAATPPAEIELIPLNPTTPAEFASFEEAGIQAELRKPEYLALISDFRSRMAEEGPQSTAANIELVRGIDGEISRDFAKLFGEEGYGELGGFPIGPVLGVPLREKLQAASDANLSGEMPRLFAGINTDAPFEDQVTAAFNVIGGRATDEQFLHVMNAISEGRNTSSSAFVVDITAARLTSEVGALEARGYGYDFFNRVSQAEDFNREAWLAPGGGATLFGSLAKIAQGFSSDVSLVSDNLAPVDMQKAARNSLILDAFTIAGPVAATKLFSAGKALLRPPNKATFANDELLAVHFKKHGAEFRAQSAEEYLQVGQDIMQKGHKIEYFYESANEVRTGYVSFMRNSKKSGESLFGFVGTNSDRAITTIHVKPRTELFDLLGDSAQSRLKIFQTDTVGPAPQNGWKYPYK